jgi:hypothetical protein
VLLLRPLSFLSHKFKELLKFSLNTYLKLYLICAYLFPVTGECETCIVSYMNGMYLYEKVIELQRFQSVRVINIRTLYPGVSLDVKFNFMAYICVKTFIHYTSVYCSTL